MCGSTEVLSHGPTRIGRILETRQDALIWCAACFDTIAFRSAEKEMPDKRIRASLLIFGSAFGLGALCLVGGARVTAQNQNSSTPSRAQKLSEQEFRGEGLFLQRCSLCHLPRKLKFGSPPVIGPSLSGQFKDATPEQMKVLRNFILKGGPDMPGFQFGLEPKEVDDLIAYLKTL